jgi:hypothetical protein
VAQQPEETQDGAEGNEGIEHHGAGDQTDDPLQKVNLERGKFALGREIGLEFSLEGGKIALRSDVGLEGGKVGFDVDLEGSKFGIEVGLESGKVGLGREVGSIQRPYGVFKAFLPSSVRFSRRDSKVYFWPLM